MNQKAAVQALSGLINGEPQRAIAKRVGVSQPTIHRIRNELKDKLESFQLQLIDSAGQQTVDNISTTIGRASSVLHDPTIKHEDLSDHKTLLDLSHKKEVLVAQAMGILPSHSPATIINNIVFQDNRTSISPEIQQIMQHQLDQQTIEDGEYEVIEDD
jgi:tRNA A-37 threonylcarbamoyl transferase component Bud32